MYKKILIVLLAVTGAILQAESAQYFEDIHELSLKAHSVRFNIVTTHSYNVGVTSAPNLIIEQQHTHLAVTEGNGSSATTPVTITVPHGCHLRINISNRARATLDTATAPLVLIIGEGGVVNVYSGSCPVLDVTIAGTGTVNMHNTQLGDVYKNVAPTGRFLTNTRPDLLTERVAPEHSTDPHNVRVTQEIQTTFIPFFAEHFQVDTVTENQSFRSVLNLLNSPRFYADLRIHGSGDTLAETIRTARCTDEEREILWYTLALRAMAGVTQRTVVEKHDGHPVRSETAGVYVFSAGKMYKESWATLYGKLPKMALYALITGGIGGIIGYALKQHNQSVWPKIGYSLAGAGIGGALSSAIYTIAHFARNRYRKDMEKVIENLLILKERWGDALPQTLREQLIEFFDQLEEAPYSSESSAALHKRHTLIFELYQSIKTSTE